MSLKNIFLNDKLLIFFDGKTNKILVDFFTFLTKCKEMQKRTVFLKNSVDFWNPYQILPLVCDACPSLSLLTCAQ